MSIEKFKQLIVGKSVALVGPAAYMMGSGLGKEINSYDVVVRINRSHESVDKFSNDIGSRTDILYSCLIEKNANAGKIDPIHLKNLGIKQIVAPPASSMKGLSDSTRLHELIDIKKARVLDETIGVRVVDHHFHNSLALKVDCRPNTGYVAIFDLLRFSPKRLGVYGFSFYLDGFVDGVKEGVQLEQGKTPDQFATQCFNSKRHVQKNMWKYAKETLSELSNVHLDNTLKKILSMESFSREMFLKEMSK
tara:strand:+ start:600 stop:1346 length:747 start_codon:yes stop_codon:yes gene_type:complete